MTRNEAVIEKIKKYQQSGQFHPLTCGKNSNHQVLEPVEVDGNVILKCPDCDYIQKYIPGFLAS